MSTDLQTDSQLADVQERLMRMLDSVRLEKAAEEPEPARGPLLTSCASCGSTEPWGTSSWCPTCGYYPKLGRAMTPAEMDANALDSPEDILNRIPLGWTLWLALGGLALIGSSVAVRLLLPDVAERGSWGRLQFVFGLVAFLIAHVRAFMIAARQTDIVPLHAVLTEPVMLWQAVFKQLPVTQRTLLSGCWGMLAVVLALSVVGMDFDGMFAHLNARKTKKFNPLKAIVKAAAAAEGSTAFTAGGEDDAHEPADEGGTGGAPAAGFGNEQELEKSMKALADSAGANDIGKSGLGQGKLPLGLSLDEKDAAKTRKAGPKKIPLAPSGEERSMQSEFYVFGYLTNPTGEVRSLLLADIEDKKGRFVSKLPLDDMDRQSRQLLEDSLDRVRTPKPALATPYRARWVRPVIKCRVAYVGWSQEGQIREGYLVAVDDSQALQPPQGAQNIKPAGVTR